MKHIKWSEIPAERLNDQFVRKIAWDGKLMIALTEVDQGYVVPLHSHDNEQITWVMSGKWRFTLEGKTVDVGPGEMIRCVGFLAAIWSTVIWSLRWTSMLSDESISPSRCTRL